MHIWCCERLCCGTCTFRFQEIQGGIVIGMFHLTWEYNVVDMEVVLVILDLDKFYAHEELFLELEGGRMVF